MVYDVKNVIAIPTRKGNTQLNNERLNAKKRQRFEKPNTFETRGIPRSNATAMHNKIH